ncbi:MAG: hypothetical protein ACP5GI_02365 [Sulfolobales archaeon]
MSPDEETLDEYRFVEVRDELGDLANIYVNLIKRFRKDLKHLSRDKENDVSKLGQTLERIRVLRARLRFLLEFITNSLTREEIRSDIREDLEIITSFFELSALRDERSMLEKLIKLRPELKESLEKDLRDIEYIQNIATKIYVVKKD